MPTLHMYCDKSMFKLYIDQYTRVVPLILILLIYTSTPFHPILALCCVLLTLYEVRGGSRISSQGGMGKGGHTQKKLRRAEGGAKIFGVFRVKNHDFTPKNLIFSNFRGGGCAECAPPPWVRPWKWLYQHRKVSGSCINGIPFDSVSTISPAELPIRC